ncbi:MAG: trypsin-like peptidase domain-containing protein [Bdellovibrionaceae bacterium]|nr:trypsin-like peptidase domain-containing protein [Pseudobdellovibrionaceae bacterium]
MNFKKWLLSIFCTSLLLACSNSKDSNPPFNNGSELPTYMSENYSHIKKELYEAHFSCVNSSDCPNNVGLLMVNYDGQEYSPQIATCTAFLIDDNIIATNSHCVPEYLKAKTSSCEDKIAVRFLNQGKNIFGCKEVLDYSEVKIFQKDFAFLKIESTKISPLKIHKAGLSDNEPLKIIRMTPNTGFKGGVLETETCKTTFNSLLNFYGATPWSPTSVALGCEGVHGNSGSPVLNQVGDVVGILQSNVEEGYRLLIKMNLARFGLSDIPNLPRHVQFTNLSCVDDPINHVPFREKCDASSKLLITDCMNFQNEETKANDKKVAEQWKSKLSPIFIYKFKMIEGDLKREAIPVCVKTRNMMTNYDQFVAKKGLIGFRKETISLSYLMNTQIASHFRMDEEYRLDSSLNFSLDSNYYSSINLVREGISWQGTYTQLDTSLLATIMNKTTRQIQIQLPDCSEEQLKKGEYGQMKLKDGRVLENEDFDKYIAELNERTKPKAQCK